MAHYVAATHRPKTHSHNHIDPRCRHQPKREKATYANPHYRRQLEREQPTNPPPSTKTKEREGGREAEIREKRLGQEREMS